MIAKAKSISHGIRAMLYVSGESRNKKHPEKITRICDNFMPQGMDASGIWTEMKFSSSPFWPTTSSKLKYETGTERSSSRLERGCQNGLERRLLATVRWTVATAVAFLQKSESISYLGSIKKRLTEVPWKQETSLNLLEIQRCTLKTEHCELMMQL